MTKESIYKDKQSVENKIKSLVIGMSQLIALVSSGIIKLNFSRISLNF